jgi:phosphohistidine phosphatase
MVELLVMRHAKSDWSLGLPDFQRPLNGRGVAAADQMADWLVEASLRPDQIISSSAERARATALAVVYGCGVDRAQVEFEDRLYGADASTWITRLRSERAQRILICGHNPGLDDLVDYLAAVPPSLSSSGKLMTTAAVAHFRFDDGWDSLTGGGGDLVSLVRPREL